MGSSGSATSSRTPVARRADAHAVADSIAAIVLTVVALAVVPLGIVSNKTISRPLTKARSYLHPDVRAGPR